MPYFAPFLEKWRGNEKCLDGHIRACRIHDLLASIEDVDDDSMVPDTWLLREFIAAAADDIH